MPQIHSHKTLVTFGDSWPQGGELKEDLGQYPYGRQLAEQYGYKFANYGSPGASICLLYTSPSPRD